MSNDNPTVETPATEAPATEQTTVEDSATDTTTTETTEDGDAEGQEPPKLSYEDLEQALAAARREAAGYRTQRRELEEKLQSAKTPEEVESLVATAVAEREEQEKSLLREAVAAKAGLPDYLAKKLSGATREELEADAAELAKFVLASDEREPDLKGGARPGATHDEWLDKSPQEIAAAIKQQPVLRRR